MNEAASLTGQAALYALAREACTGARALDLGCGLGDGASLLAGWGARRVVGVDASEEIVHVATTRNPTPRVSFRVRDACGEDMLADLGAFDLVIAVDLAGRVAEPARLLATVKARLAPGGVAIVALHVPEGGGRAAARDFTALCRETVGPPTQILVGMPVVGTIFVDSEARRLDPVRGIADRDDVFSATRIPGGEGSIDRARSLVMVWGQTLPDASAIAYEPDPPAPEPRRGWLARLGIRRRSRPRPARA
jgi:SAM-dependent methyltransferase